MVRYRRRTAAAGGAAAAAAASVVGGTDGGRGRAPGGFRVVVDRDLCQGHAVCESEAPGIFSVSKKGELTVVEEAPPGDRRADVERAVRECPTHALRIVEED
ncbi:MAG: ferredoxin [Acidimicrobiales bacterium]